MEDLQQSQIRDSCKLALPEGLNDLMCDITREVLRAQPQNLYQYIADYLSALLVARNNLTIAAQVCKEVCNVNCQSELDDELRKAGLTDEEVAEAKEVVLEYLEKDKVKEEKLLTKLMRKTNIEKEQLPAVIRAIRKAFKQHKFEQALHFDANCSGTDEVSRATQHTLNVYRKSTPNERQSRHVTTPNNGNLLIIQDLYVPNNKSYMNTESLTSLAGSFLPQTNASDCGHFTEKSCVKEQNEEPNEEEKDSNDHICDKKAIKQVFIDVSDIESNIEDKTDITEEKFERKFEEVKTNLDLLDNADLPLEVIDDEAVDADDESDISIDEELDEDNTEI